MRELAHAREHVHLELWFFSWLHKYCFWLLVDLLLGVSLLRFLTFFLLLETRDVRNRFFLDLLFDRSFRFFGRKGGRCIVVDLRILWLGLRHLLRNDWRKWNLLWYFLFLLGNLDLFLSLRCSFLGLLRFFLFFETCFLLAEKWLIGGNKELKLLL